MENQNSMNDILDSIDLEKEISNLEEEINKLRDELVEKENRIYDLNEQLDQI